MTMHHPHADDLIGAYVLDAVDAGERDTVEGHLGGCDACQAEARELSEAAVHLSDGYEVGPPAALRSHVLAAISVPDEDTADRPDPRASRALRAAEATAPQPRRRLTDKSVWGLVAAGLLAVGGWGIWQNVTDDLSPIDQVIQASDAKTFTTQYEGETLTVVASSSLDRAVLQADGLPVLDDGQTYQAWWVGADQNTTSAGLISGDLSAADLAVALEGDPGSGAAFALSVEPVGGSAQPTTDPVVVVPLS